MYEYTFPQNASLARKIASSGMVLLENDNILPLDKAQSVAVFGHGQINTIKGGSGSADVMSAYSVNIADGIKASGVKYDHRLLEKYEKDPGCVISQKEILQISQNSDTAIMVITRSAGEGIDGENEPGNFLLDKKEENLIENLTANFKKIVFIVNSGNIMDLSWIKTVNIPKALLLIFHPGMEGGNATADVLTGKVTPSGKLTDTIAFQYFDYPSSSNFSSKAFSVEYSEDIYVGYRYFETFAPENVIYPFGYGLSYTNFKINYKKTTLTDKEYIFDCEIINTGERPGREVVQIYYAAAEGKLNRPKRQLIAFKKSPELQAGDSCNLQLRVPVSSLAVFDDSPGSCNYGCWIMENGEYSFFIGNSVRNAEKCKTLRISEERILQKCGILLQGGLSHKINQHGEFRSTGIVSSPDDIPKVFRNPELNSPKIMLQDVSGGNASLDDFIAQLTSDELISLAHAQGPSFPRGTAGIGNLSKYGIVNIQTADGPAGLRKTVPTTAFPCGTLLASSWDEEILFQTGKAIGYEARETGIDVLLAPGLNIHRAPLCGRNFEYYSEDPLIAGKSAAAYVRGVQSEGIAATLKHFAANNREYLRNYSNSIISERALREIYLRAFEIAVKEAKPACIMTSYNILNGIRNSKNVNLILRILKGEWQYSGLVMTDWRVKSPFFEEIMAGSDIKMPLTPDAFEYEEAKGALESGMISQERIKDVARRVCRLIMSSWRFKKQDFGPCHVIAGNDPIHISGLDMKIVTSTWSQVMPCNDSGRDFCHGLLKHDPGGNDTRLIFALDVRKAGKYNLQFRIATPSDQVKLHIRIDQKDAGCFALKATMREAQIKEQFQYDNWESQGELPIILETGLHDLELRIDDSKNLGISLNEIIISAIVFS